MNQGLNCPSHICEIANNFNMKKGLKMSSSCQVESVRNFTGFANGGMVLGAVLIYTCVYCWNAELIQIQPN